MTEPDPLTPFAKAEPMTVKEWQALSAPPWRCESCKWWEQESHVGECKAVHDVTMECDALNCKAMTDSPLWTRPDFGCVAWQPLAATPRS